jgi:hypothetical protein
MAKYTVMEKEAEDDASVTYRFGPGDGRWGTVRFDKTTVDYQEIEAVPGETRENHLQQAVTKILRVWRSRAVFPDTMEYAA